MCVRAWVDATDGACDYVKIESSHDRTRNVSRVFFDFTVSHAETYTHIPIHTQTSHQYTYAYARMCVCV